MRWALTCAFATLLAACSKPAPPPKDQPPEPTAATTSASTAPKREPNVFLDAYQRPVDRAKAVEDEVKQAAEEQKAAIEDAGG